MHPRLLPLPPLLRAQTAVIAVFSVPPPGDDPEEHRPRHLPRGSHRRASELRKPPRARHHRPHRPIVVITGGRGAPPPPTPPAAAAAAAEEGVRRPQSGEMTRPAPERHGRHPERAREKSRSRPRRNAEEFLLRQLRRERRRVECRRPRDEGRNRRRRPPPREDGVRVVVGAAIAVVVAGSPRPHQVVARALERVSDRFETVDAMMVVVATTTAMTTRGEAATAASADDDVAAAEGRRRRPQRRWR